MPIGGGGGGGGIGAGLGDLVGGIINLSDPGRDGKRYAKDHLGVWREIPDPEYDPRDIGWQQLLLTGELTPETYEPVVTGDVSTITEDPALREAQIRAMLGMEQVSREGLPLQDRLLGDEAQRAVAGEFSRANEGIIRNLAARGRAGGGTELAARLATSGAGAEMARGMGSDLAQQSISNRLMAMREAERMAGATRGQDFQTAARNSEMQNRFNEWLSGLKTTAAMNAARARGDAQKYNLDNRQRLAEANTLGKFSTERENQARRDDLQDRLFRARAQRAGGMSGAYGALQDAADARQTAKQANVRSTAGGVGGIIDGILKAKKGGAAGGGGGGGATAAAS